VIKTGIFGGSFNPIHCGHVMLARQLRKRAGLDEVWLMVSPQNPLKESSGLLDDKARMEMARQAVKDEPGIVASDYEMHLPRPSYTWNTLEALRQDYPGREFTLLIGGDNWQLFDKWYRADDIRRNYRIEVYTRTPGDAGFIDISSTDIRRRIRQGESISGLVPERVEQLIKERGYYAD